MVNLNITATEWEILQDIKEIGYGELYNLVSINGPKDVNVDVTEKTAGFIKYFRRQEVIRLLIIHDSEPALAEIDTLTEHGRGCSKKHKF